MDTRCPSNSPPPQSIQLILNIQHLVQVGDVTNRESQHLYFGHPLVWRDSWQQLPQLYKRQVEGHDAYPLPGGVRGTVLSGRAPPPPLLVPAWSGHADRGLLVPSMHELTVQIERVQESVCCGAAWLGLVRTEHRAHVL